MAQAQIGSERRPALPPAARWKPRGNAASRDGSPDDAIARALGWFSIGLGLTEVVAPRGLARFLGIGERRGLIRTMGVREIASGIGILSEPRPAGWLWSRVGGDAVDVALLLAALKRSAKPGRVLSSLAAVGGVTALDMLASARLTRRAGSAVAPTEIEIVESVGVMATPEECFAYWRQLENLALFMKHLESVVDTGQGRSHWVAKGPVGSRLEWDAEIADELPGKEIAWRSLGGATIENKGRVCFTPEPAGRGTLIEVTLFYKPPMGRAGALLAKMIGEDPEQQLREDLRRLKQVMETGEIPTTEGQPSGRMGHGVRPAQRATGE